MTERWSVCELFRDYMDKGRVDTDDPFKFTLIRFQQIHNVSPIAKSFHQWRLLSPMTRPRVLGSLLFIDKDSVGFITKEELKKMMKSTWKSLKAGFWEVLIDVDVGGNGGIYIVAQNTSQV
ncbi:hypothetical protein Bca4012_024904 [Brassica carinata]